MKFNYQTFSAENTEWLEQNGPSEYRFRERALEELADRLGRMNTHGVCRGAADRLGMLGVWYYHLGINQINRGESAGWETFRKGILFVYWRDRVFIRSFDYELDKSPPHQWRRSILDVGHSCLASFAMDLQNEALWLSCRLDQSRTDGAIAAWDWEYPTSRLAVALGRLIAEPGGGVHLNDLDLKGYRAIFDHWDNTVGLASALTEAADYHVRNITTRQRKGIAEFGRRPEDIFPAEILAVYRVREWLGLPTPPIDHPLLQTPVARVPASLPPVHDEILDRVLTKIREVMPDL